MIPRQRLAVLLAGCGIAALIVPWQLAVLSAVGVVTAAVVDAILARRALVEITRTVGAIAVRGRPAPLVINTASPLSTIVKQPQTAELRVEPRVGLGDLDTHLVAVRRGRHDLPRVAARVDGPLGLGGSLRSSDDAAEIVVFPDLPGARRLARHARGGRLHADGRRRGPLGLGTDFESIRDYRDGDDARRINWLATDRTGRPMTNQYRVERDHDVVCAVDCGRLVAAPVEGSTRLDLAIDATLAIAAVAEELGDRPGVIAFDDGIRRIVRPRRNGVRDILAAVHDLEPRPVDSDYGRAFVEIASGKRAFVLIFTDIVESAAAQPLLDALPTLARRHAVAVASVQDGELTNALVEVPLSARDVYRQVAALDVDEARSHAVALLRRAGADVVEAPPASFAVACVRAYLRAKQRGRA